MELYTRINTELKMRNNKLKIIQGNNLEILKEWSDEVFNLIYIDPPFNTGKSMKRINQEGDKLEYQDSYDDYLEFLKPRLKEAYRILQPNGSFFFHIDYREAHYCKILLDKIFGRECFMNEIIWAYDYGGRSKTRWSCKHDTIFWYVKNPNDYVYNYENIDRVPYMSPELVGPEKAAKGKTPTDVWWNTIVPTNGKEKTGYPTQKPIAILDRLIKVHSNEDDVVLDFFAGSGTTGDAALRNGRKAVLIDQNPDAIQVMENRLNKYTKEIK